GQRRGGGARPPPRLGHEPAARQQRGDGDDGERDERERQPAQGERRQREGETARGERQRPVGVRGGAGVGEGERGLRYGTGHDADGGDGREGQALVAREEECDGRRGEGQADEPAAHGRAPAPARNARGADEDRGGDDLEGGAVQAGYCTGATTSAVGLQVSKLSSLFTARRWPARTTESLL